MRWLAACLFALWSASALGNTINVQIYDSIGASYSTATIGAELGAAYAIDFEPVMVLILGPSLEDERVAEQRRIVRELDPDETGVLYAIGTAGGGNYRGYSLTTNTAAELLPDAEGFRVLVLDGSGEIRLDSDSVLGADELVAETPPEG